jgi:Mannosyltransferase (PIG-V)
MVEGRRHGLNPAREADLKANLARLPADPVGPFPWRPRLGDLLAITTLFAFSRFVLILVGMVAWGHQTPNSAWRGKDRSGIRYALVPEQPLLDMWTRWDSWEYEQIAREGYWYDFNHKPRPYGTVACFPFYPLVVRALGTILGGRYVVAGLLVSNAAAIAGLVLLFQWATWWGDRRAAWLAVSAAIAFPAGLFWSALYPQSLYFLLSITSLALMMDGRTATACLLASAATATRLEGISLVPALFTILIDNVVRERSRVGLKAMWLLAAPLGLVAYMTYLYQGWGDPVLFMKVHSIFGRGLTNPLWTLVRPLTEPLGLAQDGVILTYAVGAVLVLGHVARLRWPILLYGWLMFLIPLCTGVYISIYRVHLVNAPIYMALALGLRSRWRILGWMIVAVSALSECSMMFSWVVGFFRP